MSDKVKSIINPEAVLDELAQQRAYDFINKRLAQLESAVDALKLAKARANRKQLTAGDLQQLVAKLRDLTTGGG